MTTPARLLGLLLCFACVAAGPPRLSAAEIGTGPVSLHPDVVQGFQGFRIEADRFFFAVSGDGNFYGYAVCPEYYGCQQQAGREVAVRACERRAENRKCFIFANAIRILWQGRVSRRPPPQPPPTTGGFGDPPRAGAAAPSVEPDVPSDTTYDGTWTGEVRQCDGGKSFGITARVRDSRINAASRISRSRLVGVIQGGKVRMQNTGGAPRLIFTGDFQGDSAAGAWENELLCSSRWSMTRVRN